MDAWVFRFSAKQLRAIPSRYLGFLIASGHCCNELAILLPYIIFEHDLSRANAVEVAFILTRKFTIDRVIISKIVEYGNLCSKWFKSQSASADQLAHQFKADFEPIAEKIGSARWARILRNKTSFHYDAEHALNALGTLDDDHPLQLIAGPIKGVTLFEFAEDVVSRPSFEEAGCGDVGRGMDVANKFIVDLVGLITTFHAQTTISIFEAHGLVWERLPMKLREKYCAAPGEVRVPISISSSYLKNTLGRAHVGKQRKRDAKRVSSASKV
jgi:hypothetical protein